MTGSILIELPDDVDPFVIVIPRHDAETLDIEPTLAVLQHLVESPETARAFVERVDIMFHGYDQDPRELSEIPEVREYVTVLDDAFPYWLFFLSKRHLGLQCVVWCLLPAHLEPHTPGLALAPHLEELLTSRWFPAMNQMCLFTGFSEVEIEIFTEHTIRYITGGPFPLSTPRGV